MRPSEAAFSGAPRQSLMRPPAPATIGKTKAAHSTCGTGAAGTGLGAAATPAGDGEAANEFRYQAVADQIAGLNLLEQLGIAALSGGRCSIGMETERAMADTALNDLFQPDESPAAYK